MTLKRLTPKNLFLFVAFVGIVLVICLSIFNSVQAQDQTTDKLLAFIKSDKNGQQILLANSRGQIKYALANGSNAPIDAISWSGSGNYLAATVYNKPEGLYQVWVYDLHDMSHIPAPFIYGKTVSVFDPVWFGDTLAFVRFLSDSSIWIVKPGEEPTVISDSYPSIDEMQWNDDGSQIAFTCSETLWDDIKVIPPPSVHICSIEVNTGAIREVTDLKGPPERYPFWFNGQLNWVAFDSDGYQWIQNKQGTLLADPQMSQIGTPVVNGNDVYTSAYVFDAQKDNNFWETRKFVCENMRCNGVNIPFPNVYLPSISDDGTYAFQMTRKNGSGQILLWYANKHQTVTIVTTGSTSYRQPVWQP